MKFKKVKAIFVLFFACVVLFSNVVFANNVSDVNSTDKYEVVESINLESFSKAKIRDLFKEYNVEYDDNVEYTKIEVEVETGELANNKVRKSTPYKTYKGVKYRFVKTYGNLPIKTCKKTGKSARLLYAAIDRGINIGI